MTECDNDWEDLESHIDWLCRQRDYFRDLYTILAKKKGGVSSAHLLFLNWCHI